MNTIHRLALLLLLWVVSSAVAALAENKPAPARPLTETELRPMIRQSLTFLAKDGDEWVAAKSCVSCHEMPELLWSHRAAQQRGFAIDQAKFDEWLWWTFDQLKSKKVRAEGECSLLTLAVPDRATPELVQRIAAHQKSDGTWDESGSLTTMQRRGEPDRTANLARLCLVALGSTTATDETEAVRAKAAAVLQKQTTATALESLVFRTLYARRFGKPEEVDALCQQILKQQRGDGGWSVYLNDNQSDPLATGQALYALQPSVSMMAMTAESIARAQHWLQRTQRADGSWPIDITHVSERDRSDPSQAQSVINATKIYTFWGSAWATIGLLQALPEK